MLTPAFVPQEAPLATVEILTKVPARLAKIQMAHDNLMKS